MWSLLVFGIKNWKYIVLSIVSMAIGFMVAWRIQEVYLEHAKAQITGLKIQIQNCLNANNVNQETISSLKTELSKSQSLCRSRLNARDRTIKRLRKINNLRHAEEIIKTIDDGTMVFGKPKEKDTEEIIKTIDTEAIKEQEIKDNEKSIDIVTDDPILHELNRMFIKTDSED